MWEAKETKYIQKKCVSEQGGRGETMTGQEERKKSMMNSLHDQVELGEGS